MSPRLPAFDPAKDRPEVNCPTSHLVTEALSSCTPEKARSRHRDGRREPKSHHAEGEARRRYRDRFRERTYQSAKKRRRHFQRIWVPPYGLLDCRNDRGANINTAWRAQPERITEVDRIAIREAVEVEPAGEPDRIFPG